MCCGMLKGTSLDEKIKPLAVIELHFSEGRQLGSQSVENSIEYIFLIL